MKLEGLHHITAITGDAPRNVDFYARVLGLRLVKRTVNQDDPTVYHLFYADEAGSPGADLTFFEYPNARPGRAGAGMVHRIAHRVASAATLDFWAERLGSEGVATSMVDGALRFDDFEGLSHELVVVDVTDAPLRARSTEVPDEHALQGFHAVYAGVADTRRSVAVLTDVLGAVPVDDDAFEIRGDRRGSFIRLEGGAGRGFGGAGTVHHIAWGASLDEHTAWRERVASAGLQITPVIDRFYFRSVYFREPGGILYELASIGPGFTTDESRETLGEHLALPPDFEHLRAQVEPMLTPLPDIRRWRPAPTNAS
ncbi:VOC family protein [Solirubrobacter ginsenosidimutans]|uniref:VOC family protein n=1 Tax=Solirubrobacter ginsenosidimutans TaxID=490573 RepID=A0A9X3N594_9ACTN|nr:VOC family protein [Solirubrobacter ginsenosidimutans]MDA0167373.1 VOC family protein [Solirubrobacter ginsenosidimutans]